MRDTLEQIDVTRRFINEQSETLQYCDTAACAKSAFKAGKISSMIGIEGGHQVGGSIGSIRQMYNLGARVCGSPRPLYLRDHPNLTASSISR